VKRDAPKLQLVTTARRFSEAIAEGDGISIIAEVDGGEAARLAEEQGAEAFLVSSGDQARLAEIRAAASLPILFAWNGQGADSLADADACVIGVGALTGMDFGDALEQAHLTLQDEFELVFRIDDDEQLADSLERYDPEIFVLSAPAADDEGEALDTVLDLLPDVPAGKLAIAELPLPTRDDVVALERAGVDGVIVRSGNIGELVGVPPPEV
jgi:indole-3-glycerol phosphate synthase